MVEDDPMSRKLARDVLQANGYETEEVANGEEAVVKAIDTRPDLIVMDLMFPRHGGQEILSMMQREPIQDIPVIAMTGCFTDPYTKDSVLSEPNVVEFLEKPFDPERLLRHVHRILKTKPKKKPALQSAH